MKTPTVSMASPILEKLSTKIQGYKCVDGLQSGKIAKQTVEDIFQSLETKAQKNTFNKAMAEAVELIMDNGTVKPMITTLEDAFNGIRKAFS